MLSCFRTVLIVLESKSLSLPHNLTIMKIENENFKTALKRHLNMHSFYLTDEFLRASQSLQRFLYLYNTNKYYNLLVVVMTYSTSYDHSG